MQECDSLRGHETRYSLFTLSSTDYLFGTPFGCLPLTTIFYAFAFFFFKIIIFPEVTNKTPIKAVAFHL